jgi:hypothetical protein
MYVLADILVEGVQAHVVKVIVVIHIHVAVVHHGIVGVHGD